MEAVRVLVRGRAVLQPGPVRAHLEHRLHRDAALPRHEEADLQPAAGRPRHLRHPVSWTVEFSNWKQYVTSRYVQLYFNIQIQNR